MNNHRKLVIVLIVLIVVALGSMVIASSLGETSGSEAHTMPDGTTMQDDNMP